MIVCVGNGPSVVGQSLGPLIDGFDDVVRYNKFVIKSYERDVGQKTTYWFVNSVKDTITHLITFGPKLFRYDQPVTVIYHPGKYCKKKNADLSRIREAFKKHINFFLDSVPVGYIYDLWKLNRITPSLGVMSLYWFFEIKKLSDPICVHGFDVLGGKACPNQHYYDDSCNIRGHNLVCEKEHLEKFIRDGKITLLKEDLS